LKRPRLPLIFVTGPILFAVLAVAISAIVGVVGAEPGAGLRSVDSSFFRGSCLALGALLWLHFSGPFDWIGAEEMKRLQQQELEASIARDLGEDESLPPPSADAPDPEIEAEVEAMIAKARARTFMGRNLNWISWLIAVPIVILLTSKTALSRLLDAPSGSFRLFGKDWTGAELALIGGCLALLVVMARSFFRIIVRANRAR